MFHTNVHAFSCDMCTTVATSYWEHGRGTGVLFKRYTQVLRGFLYIHRSKENGRCFNTSKTTRISKTRNQVEKLTGSVYYLQ